MWDDGAMARPRLSGDRDGGGGGQGRNGSLGHPPPDPPPHPHQDCCTNTCAKALQLIGGFLLQGDAGRWSLPGHGLVVTVIYIAGGWGGRGSEAKKKFVYLKSTPNFGPRLSPSPQGVTE